MHHDLSSIDDRDLVADLFHLVEQVRGEQDGSSLGDEAANHVPELVDAGWIEPIGRLVQNQELGVGKQAAGNAEPLAHPE